MSCREFNTVEKQVFGSAEAALTEAEGWVLMGLSTQKFLW